MQEQSKLRILWHSVAPFIRSGYGNVTKQVTSRLVQAGFFVVASCYYGIEPGGVLMINGVLCLPAKLGVFGKDSAIYNFNKLKMHLPILHTDPWAFHWFPVNLPNSCCYGPLDHINYPEEIQDMLRGYKYLISPSKFQVKEWKKYGIEFQYIPHGVDVSIFKPIPQEKAREFTGMPKGKFILGMVAANADKEPRKAFSHVFKAIRYFLDQNKDVNDLLLYLHTNPVDNRGIPIESMLRKWNIRDITAIEDPREHEHNISEIEMCYLYNSFDTLVNPSFREGFGLPILEAQACGVPCIVNGFSSMPELVKGHGWITKLAFVEHHLKLPYPNLNLPDTAINATSSMPDVYSIAECIEESYFKPQLREKYGRKARKFALQFNWDDIVNDKWIPFLEQVQEEILGERQKPKILFGGKK